jgi:two-component system sensor histidine kinase KdpD
MRDVIDTALLHLNSIEADRIKVSIADDVPIIRIDHAQISLVIQNLLQNSLKYSLPNTPIELSVTLELNYVDEEPKGVIVRIRDYGNGILTDETEKLFTPFFRSRQHRNSLIHGTGIGLALCKALVDAHGGFIEASNATKSKSRGAIFTFHLPIDRTEAE